MDHIIGLLSSKYGRAFRERKYLEKYLKREKKYFKANFQEEKGNYSLNFCSF